MLKAKPMVGLTVWLAMVAGCKETGKEQERALAAVQEARQELKRVEAVLRKIGDKTDTIEAELADVLVALEKNESRQLAVEEACRKSGQRLDEFAEHRDTAIREATRKIRETNEELGRQLKRREEEIRQLQERFKKLEETVRRLQG